MIKIFIGGLVLGVAVYLGLLLAPAVFGALSVLFVPMLLAAVVGFLFGWLEDDLYDHKNK